MKWYVYIICFALIIASVFCGIELYKLVTAESYVNGTIDINNQFTMESFSYANTSVELYDDMYDSTDTYSYSVDLKKVVDFDGERKEYRVVLNDYTLLDAEILPGGMSSTVNMDFYGTDGELLASGALEISVRFLSDKTTLTFSVAGNEQAAFFTQYFRANGIRLKINEKTEVLP